MVSGLFGLLISFFWCCGYIPCVSLSLSTSCSPVIPVFCFPPVLLPALIVPPHLSHISLISAAPFPPSLHLHIIPLLVWFCSSPCCSLPLRWFICCHPRVSCAPVAVPHLSLAFSVYFCILDFSFLGPDNKLIKAHFLLCHPPVCLSAFINLNWNLVGNI